MLPSYFDYIFVPLRQKASSQAWIKPEIFAIFRPEPEKPGPTNNFGFLTSYSKSILQWNIKFIVLVYTLLVSHTQSEILKVNVHDVFQQVFAVDVVFVERRL